MKPSATKDPVMSLIRKISQSQTGVVRNQNKCGVGCLNWIIKDLVNEIQELHDALNADVEY